MFYFCFCLHGCGEEVRSNSAFICFVNANETAGLIKQYFERCCFSSSGFYKLGLLETRMLRFKLKELAIFLFCFAYL